jgi:hypothetical protein
MYTLDEDKLNWLTDRTNRSKRQTQFLYNLINGNFEKLKELEIRIKNCFYFSCPNDKEEVEKIMNMPIIRNDMLVL